MRVEAVYPITAEGKFGGQQDDRSWQTVDIDGTWMPHAFIGTMASVRRKVEDPSRPLPTSVDDALHTMAVVETGAECWPDPIDYTS